MKKVISIARFSIIAGWLLSFLADILIYAAKAQSLIKGLGRLIYDSMLNCAGTDIAIIIRNVGTLLTIISCLSYGLIFCRLNKMLKYIHIGIALFCVLILLAAFYHPSLFFY